MNFVLILDKTSGLTSNKVVNKVKKIVGMKKAGHTGTLDLFATGVLPICFNQATKAIPYFDENYKEYQADMILGITTDTLDRTGKITSENEVKKLPISDLENMLKSFEGEQYQKPPMYSAVSINGVRLYKLARMGKIVERKPKKIYIDNIQLLEYNHPTVSFKIRCSKGTYIRVLTSDIGEKLGFGAYLTKLVRLSSGNFRIEDSNSIGDLEKGNYRLLSLKETLNDKKSVEVDLNVAEKIRKGIQLTKKYLSEFELPNFKKEDIITTHFNNNVVSVCKALIDKNQFEYAGDGDIILQYLRVFN